MSVDVLELTPIERDAFAEIANMGVSRAAASLRQMLGEQVLLGAGGACREPRDRGELAERGGSSSGLVAVQQAFEVRFPGARC